VVLLKGLGRVLRRQAEGNSVGAERPEVPPGHCDDAAATVRGKHQPLLSTCSRCVPEQWDAPALQCTPEQAGHGVVQGRSRVRIITFFKKLIALASNPE